MKKIYEEIKDPDMLFDAICLKNYVSGGIGSNIPVDESREMFERIKQLLRKQK